MDFKDNLYSIFLLLGPSKLVFFCHERHTMLLGNKIEIVCYLLILRNH